MITATSPALDMINARLFCIPASELLPNQPWLFWTEEPSDALRESLARCGQLEPVLVDSSASPRLVAGASRVRILQELGQHVWCLDVGCLSEWDKGWVYLNSNAGRERTETRLVRGLRYFESLALPDRMGEVYSALGLVPRSKPWRILSAWMKLPFSWDILLGKGHVPLACAEILVRFTTAEQEALTGLFENLSWSRGNAVNVLTWLGEICARDRLRVGDVLHAVNALAYLDSELSPKDAMAKLVFAIRKFRFPTLCEMEAGFDALARQAASGTRWKLTQPDQFESGAVELAIRVGSVADLERATRDLQQLAGHAAWAALWNKESRS